MAHSTIEPAGITPRARHDGESPATHFLSKPLCRALGDRIIALATGGGQTHIGTKSVWNGNLRWARNEVTTGGDVQDNESTIYRTIRGATGAAITNATDDAALKTAVVDAERLLLWAAQSPDQYPVAYQDRPSPENPISEPKIWFDRTANLSAEQRARVVEPIVAEAQKLDLLTAGYIQVGAQGNSVIRNGLAPLFRYYAMTTAQFSVTARDKRGTRSGWAGVDFSDWGRIDVAALARTAIDKCERSRNPVVVEPGRYTVILEPQAVSELFELVINSLSRSYAEDGYGPFAGRPGFSKIGEKVMDERITVSADPMDPDLGSVPFDWAGEPFVNVNWFERGILKELSYGRAYGITQLQKDQALSNSYAYRMSGGTTTVDEMIATTLRGIVVTRFHNISIIDRASLLCTGVTRDGLWLVERGKITKAIKNFRFTESPLFMLNNVEQLGVPQRVFRPHAPAVCPPIKARDFSFTGLMDAV